MLAGFLYLGLRRNGTGARNWGRAVVLALVVLLVMSLRIHIT